MARKFKDRSGAPWVVERYHGTPDLVFRPVEGAQAEELTVPAPGHNKDPYELSDEELQRLLERAQPRYRKPKRPPPF
ncbi:MAG: hypothetical protein V3U63_08005 [Gemmatimonadota bacterium]